MSFDYIFNGEPQGGTPTNPSLAINESTGQLYYATKNTGGWVPTVASTNPQGVNVKDFGAIGDGINDDYNSIQSALDSGAPLVIFPQGTYKTNKPLRVRNSHITLQGEGIDVTNINGLGPFNGPTMACAAPVGNGTGKYPSIPLGPALVGSGQAFSASGTEGVEGFELRDSGMSVDGLEAFCVEFWFKADASVQNGGYLMTCGGKFDTNNTNSLYKYGWIQIHRCLLH